MVWAISRAALWLLLLALTAGPLAALDPQRRFTDLALDQWTAADGLPQNAVLALGQDRHGYLWVGTQAGVARFDGVRFERFDRRRTGGIDTAAPESHFRDSAGRVWFGTRNGALRLYGDAIHRHAAAGTPQPVQAIAEWPAGRLLFGTPTGLLAKAPDGALLPAALPGFDITALLAADEGLWVGTPGRLLRLDDHRQRSIELPGQPSPRIQHLLAEGRSLWIGTPTGLWRMEGEAAPQKLADTPGLAGQPISELCADAGGSLWVATPQRLFRRPPGGGFEPIADRDFVRNAWISACFEDREGHLWLGSHTEGLFRLWDGLITRITERDGLSEPFVWSLERAPDRAVLIGSNRGLFRWQADRVERLVAPEALPDPAVYELARVGPAAVWVGTRGGLRAWQDGRLQRPAGAEALEGLQINTIVEDHGSVWVGSSGGLFRAQAGGPLAAVASAELDGTLARVRALLPLDPDSVLVGTESGLRRLDGEVLSKPVWARLLRERMVTSFLPLDDGRLLVAGLDAGIVVVASDRAVLLEPGLQLPEASLWAMRRIGDWIYVSSTEGLFRLPLAALPDPRTAAPAENLLAEWVVSMDGRSQSGQRARCCNGGARSRMLLVDDQLWLPSISGVLKIDPEAASRTRVEPLVRIEAVQQGELRHFADAGEFVLRGEHRDLRIDYTALYFRNPAALRFEYRLEGFDRDWIDAGVRRSAFYTNLPPGDFRFRVRVLNGRGAPIEAESPMPIRVLPHWHERGDVRLLLGLLALGLVAAGVLLALRAQRRQTLRLQALVAERTAQLQRVNTRLQQANESLAIESQTDPLTGLPNRRALFRQMPELLARHPEGVVLALIDLDHFKRVNDHFGHATGDVVLREFAGFLRRTIRDGDLVGRWGGEEFLVVFAGLSVAQTPARLSRLLEDGNALVLEIEGQRLQPGFSVGWTCHPLGRTATSDWAHALELADAALYDAKHRGRATWSGLVAGPAAAQLALEPNCGTKIETLVAEGRLAWVRPRRSAQTR
ncbi:ligand-binding sensor domain-containing diguanylate cyclase [Silanimonas sp.]|uniref:ligand-binding sensor domain-containing diguanylate cyclase n=1 Tax=Silanimonas sp. TaxID=1929290 RepID=UPI001BBB1DD3|nr:ligand-binding sensor domain-containing diguanylate cyclase [Silanimonas sp.]MBS3896911.1 diguanylate cyclase [Silanimonas sp.]